MNGNVPDPTEHERHEEWVSFRLSARLLDNLNAVAEREETSISEIVREALAEKWGLR